MSTAARFAAAVFAAAALAAPCGAAPDASLPYSGAARYATDAYPGFDAGDDVVFDEFKTPRWFSWFFGPSRTNAAEQLEYARSLETNGSWRAACRSYDALVREWPASPEAPVAQRALADILFDADRAHRYSDAFRAYRYLLDYYPSACDFDEVAARLNEVAEAMHEEGKNFLFFHFANTAEVRHAYEGVVLRAPGASFAPGAMLKTAILREDENELEKAVAVYETLRSVYASSPEAGEALRREGAARMALLRRHAYNAPRCRDTVNFLRSAIEASPSAEARAEFSGWLSEAESISEGEAFAAARFYDSKTRTRQSAVSAYEKYLSLYPAGAHAPEVRARLAAIRGNQEETRK